MLPITNSIVRRLSIGTPIQQVVYQAADDVIACLKHVERDLKAASRTESLVLRAGEPGVEITPKPAEA